VPKLPTQTHPEGKVGNCEREGQASASINRTGPCTKLTLVGVPRKKTRQKKVMVGVHQTPPSYGRSLGKHQIISLKKGGKRNGEKEREGAGCQGEKYHSHVFDWGAITEKARLEGDREG